MQRGQVVQWNKAKGIGYIEQGAARVYVVRRALTNAKDLVPGDHVEYEAGMRGRDLHALHARRL